MFLDLRDCVLCVCLEKLAFLFITDIFVCNVAKCLSLLWKIQDKCMCFSHLGEIAAETGG